MTTESKIGVLIFVYGKTEEWTGEVGGTGSRLDRRRHTDSDTRVGPDTKGPRPVFSVTVVEVGSPTTFRVRESS